MKPHTHRENTPFSYPLKILCKINTKFLLFTYPEKWLCLMLLLLIFATKAPANQTQIDTVYYFEPIEVLSRRNVVYLDNATSSIAILTSKKIEFFGGNNLADLLNSLTGIYVSDYGNMGGRKLITLTLDVIEAYEEGSKIKVSDDVLKLRKKIRNLEKKYQDVVKKQDPKGYTEITDQIRVIAGNMNLSNVYFGGFKTPIKGFDDFETYKSQKIDFHSGTFKKGCVKFSTSDLGVITSWEVEE